MERLFGRTNKGRAGGLIRSICLHRIWPQMGGRSLLPHVVSFSLGGERCQYEARMCRPPSLPALINQCTERGGGPLQTDIGRFSALSAAHSCFPFPRPILSGCLYLPRGRDF